MSRTVTKPQKFVHKEAKSTDRSNKFFRRRVAKNREMERQEREGKILLRLLLIIFILCLIAVLIWGPWSNR